MVVIGPNLGKTKIVLENGSDFQEAFLNKTFVKNALGNPAEEIISRNSEEIRKKQKEYEEIRNKRAEAEKRLREQNELVMALTERLNKEKPRLNNSKTCQNMKKKLKGRKN